MKAWNWIALSCVVSAMACADFDSPTDPTGGAPDVLIANPSFANDIQPIFTKRCSIGGCHSLTARQAELNLVEGYAYDDLVNVQATQSLSFRRVRPSLPDSSWLVRLLSSNQADRPGYPRMPLSALPLTANQIGTIVNWITQGAPRN